MSDLMREGFDAWWASTPILKENKRTLAEKAWQASRESLVVELPPSISVTPIGGDGIQECLDCNGEYLHGHLVVGALTAAGVKYK